MFDLLAELWPAFMAGAAWSFLAIWWWGMWLLGRAHKAAHRDVQRDRDRYYAWKREWEKKIGAGG